MDAIAPKRNPKSRSRRRRKDTAVGSSDGGQSNTLRYLVRGPSGSLTGDAEIKEPCLRRVSVTACDPAISFRAWRRRDKAALRYQIVSGYRSAVVPPAWTSVVRRLTIDRVTGELIEDIPLEPFRMSEESTHAKIAGGPRDLVTTLVL